MVLVVFHSHLACNAQMCSSQTSSTTQRKTVVVFCLGLNAIINGLFVIVIKNINLKAFFCFDDPEVARNKESFTCFNLTRRRMLLSIPCIYLPPQDR